MNFYLSFKGVRGYEKLFNSSSVIQLGGLTLDEVTLLLDENKTKEIVDLVKNHPVGQPSSTGQADWTSLDDLIHHIYTEGPSRLGEILFFKLSQELMKYQDRSLLILFLHISAKSHYIYHLYLTLDRNRGDDYMLPYDYIIHYLIDSIEHLSELGYPGPFIDNSRKTEITNYLISMNETLENMITGLNRVDRHSKMVCVNNNEHLSLEEINEIPLENWIVLNNGQCWDMEYLKDYIKMTTKGENKALPDSPSKYIWETPIDYNKIVGHPLGLELDSLIRRFYSNDRYSKISSETLNMLFKTGSIAWSRGPAWNEVFSSSEYLTDTERNEYQRLRLDQQFELVNDGGTTLFELPREIRDVAQYSDPDREIILENARRQDATEDQKLLAIHVNLYEKINNTIKNQVMAEMVDYFEKLPLEERNALKEINSEMFDALYSCIKGQECVMVTGNVLIDTYNIIAQQRGLKIMDEDGRMNLAPPRSNDGVVPGLEPPPPPLPPIDFVRQFATPPIATRPNIGYPSTPDDQTDVISTNQ